MKKMRILLMTLAIAAGIGAAYGIQTDPGCELRPQFYKYESWYIPAWTYGIDYVCVSNITVCTYYQPDPSQPDLYRPCRVGFYTWIY